MDELQTETIKHMYDTLPQVISHTLWAKFHAEQGNVQMMRGCLQAVELTARLLADLAVLAASEGEAQS